MIVKIFLGVLLGWLSAAGIVSAEDETTPLFESGMGHLRHERFVQARLAFQTLINHHPDSRYTPLCFAYIADAYHDEGGIENWAQADAQFSDFVIFYPTHELADDALFKIGKINNELMKHSGTDSRRKSYYSGRAVSALENLLADYSHSELRASAKELLSEIRQYLNRQ